MEIGRTVEASTYRGVLTTRSVLDVSGQGAWAGSLP
jgi:hypothetical protein